MSHILFFKGPADDEEFTRELATLEGLPFELLDEPAKLVERFQSSGAILFISDQVDENVLRELDAAIRSLPSDARDLNRIHFIVSQERLNLKGVTNASRPLLIGGNYVVRNYSDSPKAAAAHYHLVMKMTLRQRAFGLSNLFPDGTPIVRYSIKHSSERASAVASAEKFFANAGTDLRVAAVAATAADELLMNAISDAPIESGTRIHHATTSRRADFPLDQNYPVELYLGADKDFIAISVVDFYGSMDRGAVLAHLTKNLKAQPFEVNDSIQSNGLGLALLFKTGASLLFTSDKNKRTEVFVIIKKASSYRRQTKQVHFVATQIYDDEGGVFQ